MEVRKEVHQSNLAELLPRLKDSSILVARYISKPGKKLLEENHINYLDIAGNCHIETTKGIFFHIRGQKTEKAAKAKKYRAFNKSGIKLIYALLLDSHLVNATYRMMAEKAGIFLGTVGGILKDLQDRLLLLQINATERALANKKELLSLWVTAFNQTLKPHAIPQSLPVCKQANGNLLESTANRRSCILGGASRPLTATRTIWIRKYGPSTPITANSSSFGIFIWRLPAMMAMSRFTTFSGIQRKIPLLLKFLHFLKHHFIFRK